MNRDDLISYILSQVCADPNDTSDDETDLGIPVSDIKNMTEEDLLSLKNHIDDFSKHLDSIKPI